MFVPNWYATPAAGSCGLLGMADLSPREAEQDHDQEELERKQLVVERLHEEGQEPDVRPEDQGRVEAPD